eukprot:1809105-Amphidinium_carterae.1
MDSGVPSQEQAREHKKFALHSRTSVASEGARTSSTLTMHLSYLKLQKSTVGHITPQHLDDLRQTAGLPPNWWPMAITCFAFMNNVVRKDGVSAWDR